MTYEISQFCMTTLHKWLHQAFEERRGLPCIQSTVLRNFKLSLVDVTVLVADG